MVFLSRLICVSQVMSESSEHKLFHNLFMCVPFFSEIVGRNTDQDHLSKSMLEHTYDEPVSPLDL